MLLLTYLDFREVTRDRNRTGFYPCIIVHVLFGNSTVFSTVCFLDVCSINNTSHNRVPTVRNLLVCKYERVLRVLWQLRYEIDLTKYYVLSTILYQFDL